VKDTTKTSGGSGGSGGGNNNSNNASGDGGGTEIGKELQGLPLEYLIGAPLAASTKAQIELGKAMVEFINLLAYGKADLAVGSADTAKAVKTLPMKLQRPVDNGDGTFGVSEITVAPPLLGLVPIPSLLIETVDVDFSMQINTTSVEKDSSQQEAEVQADASAGFGPYSASVSVHGKVAAQRENTRSTDKTAKYDIRIHAAQQEQTEGMAKLMDLLASAVEPLHATPAPNPAEKK